jgi:chromosomal replication initiation ATPase DnaA
MEGEVIGIAATVCNVSSDDILNGRRSDRLVDARTVAAVMFKSIGYKYTSISDALNYKTHASVTHLIKRSDKCDKYNIGLSIKIEMANTKLQEYIACHRKKKKKK